MRVTIIFILSIFVFLMYIEGSGGCTCQYYATTSTSKCNITYATCVTGDNKDSTEKGFMPLAANLGPSCNQAAGDLVCGIYFPLCNVTSGAIIKKVCYSSCLQAYATQCNINGTQASSVCNNYLQQSDTNLAQIGDTNCIVPQTNTWLSQPLPTYPDPGNTTFPCTSDNYLPLSAYPPCATPTITQFGGKIVPVNGFCYQGGASHFQKSSLDYQISLYSVNYTNPSYKNYVCGTNLLPVYESALIFPICFTSCLEYQNISLGSNSSAYFSCTAQTQSYQYSSSSNAFPSVATPNNLICQTLPPPLPTNNGSKRSLKLSNDLSSLLNSLQNRR